MTDIAMGLFFGTLLLWVPAAWLYFDAEERGQSSYLWGVLALAPFWNVLVLVGYFIVRSRRDEPRAFPYSRGRIYLNVAVLTFWGLVAVAVAVVMYGLVDYVRTPTPVPAFETPRSEVLRERMAFAVALTLVALPAVVAHVMLWRRTRNQQSSSAEGRAIWVGLASALVSVVFVISGLIAALAVVGLVFEGVARLFEVGGEIDREFSTFAMSVLFPAVASLAVAYAVFWLDPALQRGREELRLAAPAAPPMPPVASGVDVASPAAAPPRPPPSDEMAPEARFCSQCGAPLATGVRFCSACGTSIGA